MEWLYPRRRGPEWKHGWRGQTMSSISAPPRPLLTIFSIVMLLLWLSQYTDYKSHLSQTSTNFQFFFILLPILFIIFFVVSFSSSWRFVFWQQQRMEGQPGRRTGGFPWGIAILLVVILVLLSHQSSFQSNCFGPLSRSD